MACQRAVPYHARHGALLRLPSYSCLRCAVVRWVGGRKLWALVGKARQIVGWAADCGADAVPDAVEQRSVLRLEVAHQGAHLRVQSAARLAIVASSTALLATCRSVKRKNE